MDEMHKICHEIYNTIDIICKMTALRFKGSCQNPKCLDTVQPGFDHSQEISKPTFSTSYHVTSCSYIARPFMSIQFFLKSSSSSLWKKCSMWLILSYFLLSRPSQSIYVPPVQCLGLLWVTVFETLSPSILSAPTKLPTFIYSLCSSYRPNT